MAKKNTPRQTRASVLAFLNQAKGRMVKLMPKSAAKDAVQLPIPRTPFEQYQRKKLIGLLNLRTLATGNSVLEIGCGIGDLLKEINRFKPRELYGVDSSAEMIDLAKKFLEGVEVDLSVTDAARLPFPEKSFELVVVMFELQHVFNDKQFEKVMAEICRVSRQWVVVVEETAPEAEREDNLLRRPVAKYKEEFGKKQFHLRKAELLNVAASGYVYTGKGNPWHWIRWIFSPLLYLVGFPKEVMRPPIADGALPDSEFAMALQKMTLPFVQSLDGLMSKNKGITVMRFERQRLFGRGN